MAVKMRLMRMGKTKSPHYRVVVMDGRAPRDGRYLDLIGRYDPRQEPSVVEIDTEKAVDWLRKGAQPTEAVAKLLDVSGALTEYKVKTGKIHTVATAAASKEPEETPEASEETPEVAEETPEVSEETAEPTEDEASTDEATSDASEEE
ncbi:MAG TPA: 30S ribosomal protein S16 [Acidimicrobiia bacterium]|nr:30S ribosomal protein S16 [Acidimicrobiia bacterium]